MRALGLVVLAALALPSASAQDAAPAPNAEDYLVTVAGDTLRGDVELKSPFLGKTHVVLDGERRELEEFRMIHDGAETLAVVDGRRLARLIEDGRVRLYSYETSSPGVMMPNPGPGGGFSMTPGSSSEVGYVQVGDGPVERATVPVLRLALQDNPESIDYLDRHQTLTYAQYGVTAAGVLAFAGGAALAIQSLEEDGEPSLNALLIAGGRDDRPVEPHLPRPEARRPPPRHRGLQPLGLQSRRTSAAGRSERTPPAKVAPGALGSPTG